MSQADLELFERVAQTQTRIVGHAEVKARQNDLSAVASVRFALTLTYNLADLCKIFTACLDVRYLKP